MSGPRVYPAGVTASERGFSPDPGAEQQGQDVGDDEGGQHAAREDAGVAHLGVTDAQRTLGQRGVPKTPVPATRVSVVRERVRDRDQLYPFIIHDT